MLIVFYDGCNKLYYIWKPPIYRNLRRPLSRIKYIKPSKTQNFSQLVISLEKPEEGNTLVIMSAQDTPISSLVLIHYMYKPNSQDLSLAFLLLSILHKKLQHIDQLIIYTINQLWDLEKMQETWYPEERNNKTFIWVSQR